MKTKSQIHQLIEGALRTHSTEYLAHRCGLSEKAIQRFVREPNARYRTQTLDSLYTYFGLDRDEYFQNHIIELNPLTQCLLGSYFRVKRIENLLTIDELATKVCCHERTVKRIELGGFGFYYQTDLLDSLFLELVVDEREQGTVIDFIDSMREFSKTELEKLRRLSQCVFKLSQHIKQSEVVGNDFKTTFCHLVIP